jgi:hypothetical protein
MDTGKPVRWCSFAHSGGAKLEVFLTEAKFGWLSAAKSETVPERSDFQR